MLKVNEAKLIQDYEVLVEKKKQSIAKIENDTRMFAIGTLGYNQEAAEEFVRYVLERSNGLSERDSSKLAVLEEYINIVPDFDEPLDDEVLQQQSSNAEVVNI